MAEQLFYDDSRDTSFIVFSLILIFFYVLISFLSIFKAVKIVEAHYKNFLRFFLIAMLIISTCKSYLVGIARSINLYISISHFAIRFIIFTSIYLSIFIIVITVEIFLDVYESFTLQSERKKILFIKFNKIFVLVNYFANFVFSLVIVSLGDQNWMLRGNADDTLDVLATFNWATCASFLLVLELLIRSTVAKRVNCRFGEDVLKNVKYVSRIFIFVVAFCLLVCNISYYVYNSTENQVLR